ncbi:MAG: heavy metal-responsive transcriptional regulator [Acidihalobacter sp.]|jgi:MerR family transcriptional regulator, copper efflux regulator|uniref:heavy metal-responsive transcriptional regulator n=1 Tax=Acidihalobacter sp. TaxID=1872108 RepID=UPI00307DDD7A
MKSDFTIGALARSEGVATETLRYYERLGLIEPSGRTASNYRLYDMTAVRQLRFIRRAQALGFSLTEIGELLSLHAQPAADMGDVKRLAEHKIADIERRIEDLERMKAGLGTLAENCPGHGPTAECPILATLLRDEN